MSGLTERITPLDVNTSINVKGASQKGLVKITLKDAMAYIRMAHLTTGEIRPEWYVRRMVNEKEILILTVSFIRQPSMKPQREFRTEIFIDGKRKAGVRL